MLRPFRPCRWLFDRGGELLVVREFVEDRWCYRPPGCRPGPLSLAVLTGLWQIWSRVLLWAATTFTAPIGMALRPLSGDRGTGGAGSGWIAALHGIRPGCARCSWELGAQGDEDRTRRDSSRVPGAA